MNATNHAVPERDYPLAKRKTGNLRAFGGYLEMRENGKHLDGYRKEHPTMGSSPSGAMFGYFRIRRDDCMLDIISSGEAHGDGIESWEHVSVSVSRKRQTPTWSQMCQIKNLFWRPDETVVQFHPPELEYVSFHDFCLHLWKPPYNLALPHQSTLGPVTGSRVLSR